MNNKRYFVVVFKSIFDGSEQEWKVASAESEKEARSMFARMFPTLEIVRICAVQGAK